MATSDSPSVESNDVKQPLRNVDYVMLAEFDIDEGSCLRYQYPTRTGEDLGTLANLMLPDGAHKHSRDWTIFMLNRNPEEEHEKRLKRWADSRQRQERKIARLTDRVKRLMDEEDARRIKAKADRAEEIARSEQRFRSFQENKVAEMDFSPLIPPEVPVPKMGTPQLPRMQPVPAFLYECNAAANSWRLLADDVKYLSVVNTNITFFSNEDANDAFLMIEMHKDLKYTELDDPLFVAVYDDGGTAIGIRFVIQDAVKTFDSRISELEDLFEDNICQAEERAEWEELEKRAYGETDVRKEEAIGAAEKAVEEMMAKAEEEWDEKEKKNQEEAAKKIHEAEKEANKETGRLDEEAPIVDENTEEISVPHLLYCLNLVQTRMDDTRRRGAHVLALAICTRFPFYDAFRPLLVVALQHIHNTNPKEWEGVLIDLFNSINQIDVTEGIPLTPKSQVQLHFPPVEGLHVKSSSASSVDASDITSASSPTSLETVTEESGSGDKLDTNEGSSTTTTLTSTAGESSSSNRGANPPSSPGISPSTTKTPITTTTTTNVTDNISENNSVPQQDNAGAGAGAGAAGAAIQSEDIEAESFGAMDVFAQEDDMVLTSVSVANQKIPIRLPLTYTMDTVGATSVISLIRTFGESLKLLFAAILNEERVFFLSRDKKAKEVCMYVLSAVQLVTPPLCGIIGRVYPYTSLVDMDFLEIPGFIAGGCNPIFESHPEWFDILCDIDQGKIFTSWEKKQETAHKLGRDFREPPPTVKKYAEADHEFVSSVIHACNALGYREAPLRSVFHSEVTKFLDMVGDESKDFDPEEQKRLLDVYGERMTRLGVSKQYDKYQIRRKSEREEATISKELDMYSWSQRLRNTRPVKEDAIFELLQLILTHVSTDDELAELLSHFPLSYGGLEPLALYLFHSNSSVRLATAVVLGRLDQISKGKRYINSLSPMFLSSYERCIRLIRSNNVK